MIPAHLFISLWIEVWAAHKARKIKKGKQEPGKRERKGSWGLIRFAHIVNVGVCLAVASVVVYTMVYHPFLGMVCEMHAGILSLSLSLVACVPRSCRAFPVSPFPSAFWSWVNCSYCCPESGLICFDESGFTGHVSGINSYSRRI
jgi:diacylglycerol O-acyltransferase 1